MQSREGSKDHVERASVHIAGVIIRRNASFVPLRTLWLVIGSFNIAIAWTRTPHRKGCDAGSILRASSLTAQQVGSQLPTAQLGFDWQSSDHAALAAI